MVFETIRFGRSRIPPARDCNERPLDGHPERRRHGAGIRDPALAGRQPSCPRDPRHGRHRPVLCRRARHAGRGDDEGRAHAPLLLRDRPAEHGGVLRDRRDRDVRKAGGRPAVPDDPVRPSVLQPAGRAWAARPAPAAARRRVRVHRGRRPRVRPLGVLHGPERHRARSVVVGDRRHRAARPTTRTSASSRIPSPSRRSTSCAATARCSRRPSRGWWATRSSTPSDGSRRGRQRRSAKKPVRSAADSAARTPSTTVASWFRRGSVARL